MTNALDRLTETADDVGRFAEAYDVDDAISLGESSPQDFSQAGHTVTAVQQAKVGV